MRRSSVSHHRSAWLSVLLGLALVVGSLLPASLVLAQKDSAPAAPAAPEAATTIPGLGEAAKFTLLALEGGYLALRENSELIGNVGYSALTTTPRNECTKVSKPPNPFVGTIYAAIGVNPKITSDCDEYGPSGGVLQDAASTALLEQANIDALAAYNSYIAMPTELNLGALVASQTVDSESVGGDPGITVVEASSVDYDGSDTLTLQGRAGYDDMFVIKITGNAILKAHDFDWAAATVSLVNVRPERVLWVFANPNLLVDLQVALIKKADTTFYGTILAPYALIEYHNAATFHGAIIAYQLDLHSASKITGRPFEVLDFGDAPDSYKTLMINSGPRHVIVPGLMLGSVLDAETDGQPIILATGDNTNGSPDDEEAVGFLAFASGSNPSVTVAVTNNYQTGNPLVGQNAFLQCWMDLNGDGVFDHPGEASGKVTIPTTFPTSIRAVNYPLSFGQLTAAAGTTTYLRCRVSLTTTEVDAPTGAATSGEIEDHPVTVSVPLAVNLAAFDAVAQDSRVLVSWETVSEVGNAGFNLYRAASQDGERTLLISVPSQAPGSTSGASYRYEDAAVVAGQTYWYWLEDIDLSGAATLHGPVSVVFQAPTAVTLSGLTANGAAAGLALAWPAAVAGLAVVLAAGYGLRRALGR